MRQSASFLVLLLASATASFSQSGFTTKTYPAVLPSTSDNYRLLSGDLNGDGRPDLVTFGNRYTASTSSVPANVFLNNGTGGFLAPAHLPGGGALAAAKIADMNGDGFADVVGCTNVGSGQDQAISVVVYLNNGSGTFKALPGANGSGQCSGLTVGDVFHTGHPAVVTAGHTSENSTSANFLDVYRNDGTGALTEVSETILSTDDAATSANYTNCGLIEVVGGDFRQTGSFDLLLTSDCEPSSRNFPFNVGTTFFATENADPNGANGIYSTYTHLASNQFDSTLGYPVDLTGDGKLDALYAGINQAGNSASLIYEKNNGNGSFTSSSLLDAYGVYGSGLGDFNGDGIKDLAVNYQNGNPNAPDVVKMEILSGLANGTFTDAQDFTIGPNTSLGGDVVVADLNGDGKPDIATLVYDTNARTTTLDVFTNTQGASTACAAPTTVNTNVICSPAKGATLNSPVSVTAASNVTGFTLNRLYLDNTSVYQTASQTVTAPVTAATGTHTLVLVSYNNAGKAFSTSTTFTIGNATSGGCLPATAGVAICSPAAGSTQTSPVTINAGATASSGNITALRVYIDNNAVFTSSNPTASPTYQFSEPLAVSGGTHNLTVVGYQSTGGAVTKSVSFIVPQTACTAPVGGGSIRICTPSEVGTTSSPFTVSAASYTSQGYIAAMRIYLDNVAVATVNNTQKSQAFTINQQATATTGTHTFVVVAYPSTGGSLSSEEKITVK